MSNEGRMIERAKSLIAMHEQLFESANLEAVMQNFAEDSVLIALESPVLQGKISVESFYKGLLDRGRWSFRHDYAGTSVVGNCVFLHGVAHGRHIPGDGGDSLSFANNFLIVVKESNGTMKFWRGAFMPSATE